MKTFWFGNDLPSEFADPIVRENLSFNGQLHFRCPRCHAIIWADVTFAKVLLKGPVIGFPCPRCKHEHLEVAKFTAIESRICKTCASQTFARPGDEFECFLCHSGEFLVYNTIIDPPYPNLLFALYGRDEPFGESPHADVGFLMEYVRGLRMSPEFHQTCIHLVAFFESIFEHVYGTSHPDSNELLNAASALMRTVYRETENPDAAYLSIALMIDGYELSVDPRQRAAHGMNIAQNIYSVLARGAEGVVSIRLGRDLKTFGVSLSRKTLAALEELNEDWLGELRAHQKWLLGDLLKASSPSEQEIDEALFWFDAALKDPALPRDVADNVRESALAAQLKRRDLSGLKQQDLNTQLVQLSEQKLDKSEGIQRLTSLLDLLRDSFKHDDLQRRRELAHLTLGEAIVYAARSDPWHLLRFAGTLLARLVAGFAAERFAVGEPLQGIAGVEAFRSLAIRRGNLSKGLGHHVHELEVELMTKALFEGSTGNPHDVADRMLSQYEEALQTDLRDIFLSKEQRSILWLQFWEGEALVAIIEKQEDGGTLIKPETRAVEYNGVRTALQLPDANAPPGRLRARSLKVAVESGRDLFGPSLDQIPKENVIIFVGSSIASNWPIDVLEYLQSSEADWVRPIIHAPSVGTACLANRTSQVRDVAKILVITYSGDDLEKVGEEVNNIRKIYGSRVTIADGDVIGKEALLDELAKNYDVIHFCGHGEFDYLEPMKSNIIFHNGKGMDGKISAEDFMKLGSIGNQPIVVLSACTSALVLPNGSNNFLGLAGALIRTGATSIAGARWPVSDAAAAQFSKHFHEQLAGGSSVSASLALAKNALKEKYRLDEWGAFMSICN